MPIGGGGLTPTINMMERGAGGEETQFATVEGPTCFGGCMDLCIDTPFFISKVPGKAGDVALIKKKARDEGCMGLCTALCTTVDTYDIDFTDPAMSPQQKAAVIGEAVNLDYLFFGKC